MFFCRVCKAFLRIWPGKLFSVVAPVANRRGILDAMNREHGYTLMETTVTLTLMMILSVGGLYGWQRWQQQQRLWQTAVQVRDFLLFLRDDANAYNRDRVLRVGQTKWAGA